MEKRYYSSVYLKSERGWEDFLLKKYLKHPDFIKEFGVFKTKILFYEKSKVLLAEESKNFKKDIRKKHIKRQNIQNFINEWNPEIPEISIKDLEDLAETNWKKLKFENGQQIDIIAYNFIKNRLMVNYLRHKTTNYDTVIKSKQIRFNKRETIQLIKEKVLLLISKKYPSLKTECERQKAFSNKGFFCNVPSELKLSALQGKTV